MTGSVECHPSESTRLGPIAIVIVSYNTRDMTLCCLESIDADRGDLDVQVIVVDNDSADGSSEAIKAQFPKVTVIDSGANLGFARAVNLAVAQTDPGVDVLLLNPDAVLHPGTIRALAEAARTHPERGLFGGRVLFPDGTVNTTTARRRPTLWALVCHASMLTTVLPRFRATAPSAYASWDRTTDREVEVLSGALLYITRAAWDQLGGFGDHYFLYGEDSDLCQRATKLGYQPWFVAAAEISHAQGSSSKDSARKIILMRTGECTMLHDHWSGLRLRIGLALLQGAAGMRALAARCGGSSDVDWAQVWSERRVWAAGFSRSRNST
ncbi:MAG: glycosyltransferase family 2 protein [Ilumatobacteraceae bacterium]